MTYHHSDELNNQLLASSFLGFKMRSLFPEAELLGLGSHTLGFYCDLRLSQPLTEGLFDYIEVELKAFLKEGANVRFVSMMRENAALLLDHQKTPFLADSVLKEPQNIVNLVQIDGFFSPWNDSLPSLDHFSGSVKLLSFEKNEEGITRLVGVYRENQQALKLFLKSYDVLLKKEDHRRLVKEMELFSFSEKNTHSWLPKGMILREILCSVVDSLGNLSDCKVSTPSTDQKGQLRSSFLLEHQKILKTRALARISEVGKLHQILEDGQEWGLVSCPVFTAFQLTEKESEGRWSQQMISSLQLIEQIITIFSFEGYWVSVFSAENESQLSSLKKKFGGFVHEIETKPLQYSLLPESEKKKAPPAFALELRTKDRIGREWVLSRVEMTKSLDKSDSSYWMSCQLIASLERWIALCVEKNKGVFPGWLAPEQLRILPIGKKGAEYASEVALKLAEKQLRVKVVDTQEDLATRIHQAEVERVPYVLLIGEAEASRKEVSLRRPGKPNEKCKMKLESFVEQAFLQCKPPLEGIPKCV